MEPGKTNLEITDLQASTVSTRQSTVRAVVEGEMTVLDSFVTGSYARNTMIAPLAEADVDIFVVLDPKYFEQSGQASLLDKVKRVLLKTYTKTPRISRNGQAVTISFSDFQVDVVPAFNRHGGGFLIPDSIQSRWISTDPKRHVELWTDANKAHAGDLVPLIKMIKGWNKAHSETLRSFYLEAMIVQVLQNVTISDFPSGARFVFDKLRAQVQTATYDPAGYGGDLGDYLDTYQKKRDALDHLETAFAKAQEAESFERQGKTGDAFGKWRIVFGDYFPAY
jgi:hypothetical protein